MTAPDPGVFRFEYVCEAIAPDNTRRQVGSFAVPATCLLCRGSVINQDFATATANVDGSTMATFNNEPGLVCASCTTRERSKR
jgi:hypothetical protein